MNKKMYDLTTAQKNILSLEKYYSNTSLNTNCGVANINQVVDFDILSKSISLLIKNNSIFQFKFKDIDDITKQYISNSINYTPKIHSINDKADLIKIKNELSHKALYNSENLFEFEIYKLPNNHGGIIGIVHHLLSDSWGVGLMFDEILRIYNELKSGSYEDLESKYNYIDHIAKEEEYLSSSTFLKDKVFWNDMYKTIPSIAVIPSAKKQPNSSISCIAERISSSISRDVVLQINDFCKKYKISVYNFFMAVFSIYIATTSNTDDFVIGTPILNRTNFADKHTMGMFVSTVPFRITLDQHMSFCDFAQSIAQKTLSMLRHQKYPYENLLQDLRKTYPSIPNLYNTVLSYQITKLSTGGLNCSSEWIFNGTCADDIQIHIVDYDNTGLLDILYDYKTDKYFQSDITNMHNRICYIINQILENNFINISDIEIITPKEKNQILCDFNNTTLKYSKNKTIVELFEEQVAKTPDKIAIIFEDTKIKYSELNEYVNSLAHHIRNQEIHPNDVIGIMVNRSIEMIVSILAVLKSGACYVPIDPTYPQERIEYMLNNSGAKTLLTFEKFDKIITSTNKIFVELSNPLYKSNKDNLEIINNSQDLAYIIYTSGSTGKPKGVMLTHQNVNNFIAGMSQAVDFSNNKTIVSVTTISFDIFVLESILPLQKGLTVIIANENEQNEIKAFNSLCIKNNVNIIQTTPSRFNILISDKSSLDYLSNITDILVGGEALSISLLSKLKKITNAKIYNVYGPTETTVWSTVKDLTKSDLITIGKPIANTYCYILDKNKKLLPPFIPGILHIGGDGVSKGYFNLPELTKEKFFKNKYTNQTIYNTGDLAYFTDQGELIYLGRNDFQVKVNGHRIELDEISNQILKNDDISNCIVISKTLEDGHSCLCAYYTIKEQDIDIQILRSDLNKVLPHYMVPQYFVKLDNFPYTPNGKIDRKNLPLPVIDNNREIIDSRNEVDNKLINILETLLNVSNISIADSFFDLGGDSLTAINLCSKIYNEFDVQLYIQDIFEARTICNISDLISKNNIRQDKNIPVYTPAEFYPASYAQSRIYFSSKLSGNNSTLYNITGGLIFEQRPDVSKLENAFNEIFKNQSSLRTYFQLKDGSLVQKIKDNITFDLDVSNQVINESEIETIFNDFNTPFDLEKPPLFKAKLLYLDDERALLMISTHHIICDGTSLNILINQLEKAYNSGSTCDLHIEYKDFTLWENNLFESGKLQEAEDYWANQFTDIPPNLQLKYESRNSSRSFSGDKFLSRINSLKAKKIEQTASNLGVTPFMLLLSVYYILLYKYTMQEDIVVGTPIINRNSPELDNLIGMFVNTLPLRTSFSSNLNFAELLDIVKNNCLSSYKYQNYPLDKLLSKLNINSSKNSLFNTAFVLQNRYKNPMFDGIATKHYIPNTKTSKFDLTLEIIPSDNGLDLSFEYASKLFDHDFISNLSDHYLNILDSVLNNTNIKIADITMISKQEYLTLYNPLKLDYPKEKTIASLFEAQANLTPNNIAVTYKDINLTFKDLNIRANKFGNYLLNSGVKKGDIVSVLLPRSIDLIITMLALNKIGAAYLPLSVEYPQDRIDYILNHSHSKLTVTLSSNLDVLPKEVSVIAIDNINLNNLSSSDIKINISPSDVLYVLYTSGSTGNPKGVMVTNNNLNNFIHNFNHLFNGVSSKERVLASTNICFDVSIFEFYISLLNGARLYLYDENIITDIYKYCNTIINNKISMLYIPPNILEEVYTILNDNNYTGISKLLIGVEPIKTSIINKYNNLNKDIAIVNGYGPTEATICTTAITLDKKILSNYEIVPIGKPLYNMDLRILDKDLNPLPQNVAGELYISGENLSKGYLNDTLLTSKSFIKLDGNILYKTGDIVVLDDNHNYNFICRNDSQIKLNGHRIELGEIEKNIYSYPNISKVVIIINEQKKLVAYFTASSNININDLKLFLQTKLPSYFIPNFFVQVDKFRLTDNGKIDKKSLLKIKLQSQPNYEAPSTENEKKLVTIFESVLNLEKISINDDFFDIGGDSLSAIKLQIEAFNNGINLSYKDIFDFPTIKQLAKKISYKTNLKTTTNYDYSQIHNYINNKINLNSVHKDKIKNILLTGATGFVGCHILDYLLKHTKCNVYCLVRSQKNSDAYSKMIKNIHFYFNNKYDKLIYKRIFIIEGDITKNHLGISVGYFDKLGNTIDCVINSAAVVRHYGKTNIFNETNIIGTQNIIDFCTKFNNKLIHLSTLSVSGNMFESDSYSIADLSSDITFSEKSLFIGQDLSNVYIATKFFAERLILENIINHNLNAKIIRLGNITNRYSDGKFQINVSENAFLNRIKSFLQLESVPDYITDGYIEFTPVDLCAESIVKIALSKTDLTIFHVYNNNHITFSRLIDLFNKYGIKINILNESEFGKKIQDTLIDNKSNLSGIINDFGKNKRLSYTSKIKISNNITNKFLKKLSFKWPRIDQKYIKKYISYLRSIGYLNKSNL